MEKIKVPKDMDDAKALGIVLSKYKDTYYTQVLVAYFATYILYPWRKHMELLGKNISQFPVASFPVEDVFRNPDLQRQSGLQRVC